jgi:hypothetical protein
MLGKTIEIGNNDHTNRFDPDPDSDPENSFEKHQFQPAKDE